jgi:2-polyprenyl-3-methyl-5-hydroxy-6-metoxy-1,4-benzoquinol methylase
MADQADQASRTGQFGPVVYADWRESSLGEITEELEHRLIFRLTGSLRDKLVLDAGCGDGTLAQAAASQGAARVTGCDLDLRMVGKASATAIRNGMRIDFTVARLQALPFSDNTFDVVTCITVLAFVPDAIQAVREMARVLRPGGCLVIGDLGKWSIWAARRRVRGWFGAKIWRTAKFRTAKELTGLTEAAGLMTGSVKGAIFYPPLTRLARLIAPLDPTLGETTTLGAAFVAIQVTKP